MRSHFIIFLSGNLKRHKNYIFCFSQDISKKDFLLYNRIVDAGYYKNKWCEEQTYEKKNDM